VDVGYLEHLSLLENLHRVRLAAVPLLDKTNLCEPASADNLKRRKTQSKKKKYASWVVYVTLIVGKSFTSSLRRMLRVYSDSFLRMSSRSLFFSSSV